VIQFSHKEDSDLMNHCLAVCNIKEYRRDCYVCMINLIDQIYTPAVKVTSVLMLYYRAIMISFLNKT